MNKKIMVLGLILLFSSCVVKSLQPFYLTKHIQYDESLLGKWTDQKNGEWKIVSFRKEWEENEKDPSKISEESLAMYEKYKESFIVNYSSGGKEAEFVATPFKVDEHLFLDFSLFEYSTKDINGLAAEHLLKTHSSAYVQFTENDNFELRFISEDVVKALFKEGKLRLKHEKIGVGEDLILTASSEELYQFLRKFMEVDIETKWKSDDTYTLKASDA